MADRVGKSGSGVELAFGGSRLVGLALEAPGLGDAIDRPAVLGRILGGAVVEGGLGVTGLVMGPTMMFGIFGAGAGMYGCLRPPDSDTAGAFRGAGDGVRIPVDSPLNLGLSSQLDETGVVEYPGRSVDGTIMGGGGVRP